MTSKLSEVATLLEFDKILSTIKKLTISEITQEKFDQIEFMTGKGEIQTALNEASEFRDILEHDTTFPLQQIWDIRRSLEIASITGNHLESSALIKISQNLECSWKVRSYLHQRKSQQPRLWEVVNGIQSFQSLVKEMRSKIDFQSGEIKSSASPKLNKIRKEILRAEQNARKAVERSFKSYSEKGYLQESVVSLKDGRLVLPVKWEHRAKVNGLVHDQSGSGATLFIEPGESVEYNNHLRSLRIEETLEIERILKELTSLLRDELEGIYQNQDALIQLDFIGAKAEFGRKLNCTAPLLNEENVKNNVILPFLQSLGFDKANLSFEDSFEIRWGHKKDTIDSKKNARSSRSDILVKENGTQLFVI